MSSSKSVLAWWCASSVLLGGIVACASPSGDGEASSKRKESRSKSDDDGDGDESKPETKAPKNVDPSLLGTLCTGVGGSPGSVAAFEKDSCKGGLCVYDGVFEGDTYCSAACSDDTCPADWACTKTEGKGATSACTKDPAGPWNPFGAHYPVEHLGWTARGATPGDVLANVKFEGLAPGESELAPVQFASLYDPTSKAYDAIAVYGTTVWDGTSGIALNQLAKTTLERIAVVVVVGYGSRQGVPATAADLMTIRAKYPATSRMWVVLDPEFATFAPALKDTTILPHRVVLDARSMEIVESSSGLKSSPSQGDQLASMRTTILSTPPAYATR